MVAHRKKEIISRNVCGVGGLEANEKQGAVNGGVRKLRSWRGMEEKENKWVSLTKWFRR